MEIVCPAWHPGAEKLVQAIPLLADQGVTAVEIGIDSDYFDHRNPYELQCLMEQLSKCGVRVHSVHSPFGPMCDISSPEDAIHERGVDSMLDAIEVASVLETGIVIVHASDVLPVNGPNGRVERARGVLRELALVAKETGVMLALENLPPGYLAHSPEQIAELLETVAADSVGLCFDTGHANLSGRFAEFVESLLPLAVTTHIHDNNGAEDQHQFPGLGTIDWPAFGRTYRRLQSSASIMLECVPPDHIEWSEAFQRLRVAMGD